MAALDALPSELRHVIAASNARHSPAAVLKVFNEGVSVKDLIEAIRWQDAKMSAAYRRAMERGGD